MLPAIPTPQPLRVFLSSPGDVADERTQARKLIEQQLRRDPSFRHRAALEAVTWDDPDAPIPMLAQLTPQEAVNRFGPRPSACDIVVVILWSRLGTPLPDTFRRPDGERYLSGTEWEYEDALKGNPQPDILVYRRTEPPKISLEDPDDPKIQEALEQRRRVNHFFTHFRNPNGSLRGGVTEYDTPSTFVERFESDLRNLIERRLERQAPAPARGADAGKASKLAPIWTGSPYPGLRPFTAEEAAIFFGRGREVDILIAQLRDPAQRFLAVIGASGTGKSSLVRAGLIPRLQDGALEGSQHWRVVTFTPGALGDNPFLALAVGLGGMLPAQAQKPPIEIAKALAEAPQCLLEQAAMLLAGQTDSAVLVLFVDQLEELFTLVADKYRSAFAELLAHAIAQPHLRVVATLRADFLPQTMAEPVLAPLLQAGTVPLGPPGMAALADMIRKPAERAGLELEDGLADEIVKDAGTDPPLPLVAFCLKELYQQTAPEHRLTVDAYIALGRLSGAISRRAKRLQEKLREKLRETEGNALDTVLPPVFQALIHVDVTGTATRRRAFRDELCQTAPISLIIDQLIRGRLLAAEDADGRATVTLAHEMLLQEWPDLRKWVNSHRVYLQRVQTLITALRYGSTGVRRSAAESLGDIGPATADVIPTLIAALVDDPKEEVRISAAMALARIGPPAAEAMPALTTARQDSNRDLANAAKIALEQIRSVSPDANST